MSLSPVYPMGQYAQYPMMQSVPPAMTFPLPYAPYRIIHLRYDEAQPWELSAITPDGSHRLRHNAARAFFAMQQAARMSGVDIQPVSSFRTAQQQVPLFYEEARKRNQTPAQRAQVVAPPGYSEHHTGYAIDLKDGRDPKETELKRVFQSTPTFQWLWNYALQFGFELSFPKDNWQGISYEPWHWRYIGDAHSQETFLAAHRQGR